MVNGNKSSILENKEQLLIKKKRAKVRKRMMVCIIILVSVLVTLCLKLTIFNVTSLQIVGNKNVTKEEIIASSHIAVGSNIFTIKTKNAINNILKNPYIVNVKVKRKLPNKIKVEISERKATFYTNFNKEFYIIDNEGRILEKTSEIKNNNLIEVKDLDISKSKVGELITFENEDRINLLNELCDEIYNYNEKEERKITSIELSNFIDIKLYCNSDLYIKIGTQEDINNKLMKALNILKSDQLKGMKGYVDVSFNGNPVIYKK